MNELCDQDVYGMMVWGFLPDTDQPKWWRDPSGWVVFAVIVALGIATLLIR